MNRGCLVASYGTILAVTLFVSNLCLLLERVAIYEDSQSKAWSPRDAQGKTELGLGCFTMITLSRSLPPPPPLFPTHLAYASRIWRRATWLRGVQIKLSLLGKRTDIVILLFALPMRQVHSCCRGGRPALCFKRQVPSLREVQLRPETSFPDHNIFLIVRLGQDKVITLYRAFRSVCIALAQGPAPYGLHQMLSRQLTSAGLVALQITPVTPYLVQWNFVMFLKISTRTR